MRFPRIDRGKDPNFCSVRVNVDIRLIGHRRPMPYAALCSVGERLFTARKRRAFAPDIQPRGES